jgi:hypothetical protein
MARKKQTQGEEVENVSAYWRAMISKNRRLLRSESNEPFYNQWLADHPGHETVPDNWKAGLSTVKSILRNRPKKGKRKKKGEAPAAPTPQRQVAAKVPKTLVGLEKMIDDCLLAARDMDRGNLSNVIDHLRYARNAVVVIHHAK